MQLEAGEHLRPRFEGVSYIPGDAVFIGNKKGAVAIFNYDGENCEIAMSGDSGWLNRTLIRAIFLQIFEVMSCARVTARVLANNERALSIDTRIGFVLEGRLRSAVDGHDVFILGMLKNECRWINEQSKSTKAG